MPAEGLSRKPQPEVGEHYDLWVLNVRTVSRPLTKGYGESSIDSGGLVHIQ